MSALNKSEEKPRANRCCCAFGGRFLPQSPWMSASAYVWGLGCGAGVAWPPQRADRLSLSGANLDVDLGKYLPE